MLREAEGGGDLPGIPQRFFVAVDVENDVDRGLAEISGRQPAGGDLAVEEFVEGEDVGSERAGFFGQVAP